MELSLKIWMILKDAWVALLQSEPLFVSAAILVYLSNLPVIGLRWKIIAEDLGGKVLWSHTTLANLAGIFVNNITPASRIGGEATRIALIRDKDHLSTKIATVSSVYDRLTEIPGLIVLTLMAIPVVHQLIEKLGKATFILLIVAGALGLVLFLHHKISALRNWIYMWVNRLRSFHLSKSTLFWSISLSNLLWILDLFRLHFACLAFDVHLNILQLAALVCFTIFGGLVPTVGGIGAIEGGLIAGLIVFGVQPEQAVAITAVERGISYILATTLGGVTMAGLGGRHVFKKLRKTEASIGSPGTP